MPDPTDQDETVDCLIEHAKWLFAHIYKEGQGTERHAGQCVLLRRMLQHAREQSDVAQTIRAAYMLGVLSSEVLADAADPTFVRLITENAQSGSKSRVGGRQGHERAHGTQKTKDASCKAQFRRYTRYLAMNLGKTVAMRRAAADFKVSVKTIQRARKKLE